MNNHFSIQRFGRLFRRHTAEHVRGYLMAAVVLAGAMLLVMSYIAYMMGGSLSPGVQMVFFILFLLGAGGGFSSGIFADFGGKNKAIVSLALPASHLEKFMVAWLYSLPIFLLVFTGLFYLVDAAVVYGGAQPGQTPILLDIQVFSDLREAGSLFIYYAVLHGAWLWGSIFFEKAQFVKMGCVLFVVGGVAAVLNFQLLKWLLEPTLAPVLPFMDVVTTGGEKFFRLALPTAQTDWLGLLLVVLALLLWLAAYFRMTEKQL